jgi:putative SOS response-associated peptidase YedK
MCGRYTLTRQDGVVEEMQATLGMVEASEWWKPRFNVAPTQPAPVVIARDGARTLEMMRWGLVPHWAGKSTKKPPLMINARVESIQDKPVFRDAFARRRCLVPADGFFEWKRDGKKALPLYFRPVPRRVFAFAGVWMRAGDTLSFAVITGGPNALVAPIHDRMPIVIDHDAYAAWLDPALDADGARALLHVPAIGDWHADFVSTRVNAAANDDPSCIEPERPVQGSLF